MTDKSSGFIALLLVIAILLSLGNSYENEIATESPLTVYGDSFFQNETHEDSESDTAAKIIAVVVFVLFVVFIIYSLSQTNLSQGTDNQ